MTPRYSTDLTDAQWTLVEAFFPAVSREDGCNGRPRKYPYREILNGIFYLLRAGCAWELLPHDFPPHATCYHYFRLPKTDFWRNSMRPFVKRSASLKSGTRPPPPPSLTVSR